MKTIPFILSATLAFLSLQPLFGGTTQGPETISLGSYATSTWHSDDFKGTTLREWDSQGKAFSFTWKTDAGDQIERVGVSYGSPYLGVKIDDIRPDCLMKVNATFTPATDHWFWWSIYGWAHRDNVDWSRAGGWSDEFYIIMSTDMTPAAFLMEKGRTSIGSVIVDGETYDCYKTIRSQSQWMAVRRSKTWSGSVDLNKIYAYWRSQGLPDNYVVDLGWAVEGFKDSAGKLQLTDIVIPNLTTTSAAKSAPGQP